MALAAAFCALGIAAQLQADERVAPSLNAEATALVGGQMFHQGNYYPQAAIHLSEEIQFGDHQQYSLTPRYYVRNASF